MPQPDAGPPATGLRRRILDGELVLGMMVVEFFTPSLPGVLARAGLDFAVFDMEASGLSHGRFQMLAALSTAAGLTPIVRVPEASAATVGRCLDLGAVGVMAPKVQNADEARALASHTHYPPDGDRGSGYRAHPSGYVTATSSEDRRAADASTITVVQLETVEAVDEAEEIVAIPGIDVLNVGANDLAAQLGVEPGHPAVTSAIDRVRQLCVAHGKGYLGRPPRVGAARSMVLLDHDVAALSAHTSAGVRAIRKESNS